MKGGGDPESVLCSREEEAQKDVDGRVCVRHINNFL